MKLSKFCSAIISKSLISLDELREIFLNNCPGNIPLDLTMRMRQTIANTMQQKARNTPGLKHL